MHLQFLCKMLIKSFALLVLKYIFKKCCMAYHVDIHTYVTLGMCR